MDYKYLELEYDVYSDGTCFIIDEPGITLDCNGYSIFFGSGGISADPDPSAIKSVSNDDITIKNCDIVDQFPVSAPYSAIDIRYGSDVLIKDNLITSESGGIFFLYGDNSLIEGNSILSRSSSIYLGPSTYDTLLLNNDLVSSVTGVAISDSSGAANQNRIIYSNNFGEIDWIDNNFLTDLSLEGDIGFSSNNPTISYNNIELDPDDFPSGNINSEVELEFYGLPAFLTPFPQRNGLPCLSGCSPVTDLGSGDYKFTADGFSNYGIANNNPPQLSNLILTPNAIFTNTDAVASVNYLDLENQTGTIYFQWYVNGVNVYNQTRNNISNGSVDVASDLSSTNFFKNDQINVNVHASDGIINSTPISSTLTVLDTPPIITSAILNSTDHPLNLTDANLTAYWDFFDLDGDNITNRNISWYKDSNIQPSLFNLDTINSSETQKGEVWQFNISVETNTSWSNWYGSNLLTIENTPPVLSNILLTPGVVYTNDNLIATVDYDDINNDPGVVNFFWYVNNSLEYTYATTGVTAGSSVQSIFNSTNYSRDDIVMVLVISSDGTNNSNTLSSTITVQDTLPVITYAILNSTDHPSNLTDANLTAYWDFYDIDNDLLDFSSLRWYKDGIYQSSFDDQQVLSFYNTNFGDIWYFNISVQAGGGLSDSLLSNQLEILNSPPDTSVISFNGTSHNNYTNENLSCWIIGNDVDTNQNLTAQWGILRDGFPISNGFTNITNGNLTKLVEIDSSNTSLEENWLCSARIYDEIEYESPWNDAIVTVREPQCGDTLTISPPPLTHDLYSNGTCFSVDGDNITIDLNGYSLIGNGSGNGINIEDSDNVTVINGTIQNFSIAIFADPSVGLLFDGLTLHSSYTGIYFSEIDFSTIRNNLIYDNYHGIYIFQSYNNEIYNNFLNNTINGRDEYAYFAIIAYNEDLSISSYDANFWNQSYDCNVSINWTNIVGGNCSGGNYWSDYQGFDNGLGVNPYDGTPWNISGDGIGDTNIPANSSDNISRIGDYLPLMYYCYESWSCSDWSSCSSSHQSRDCIDLNECGRDYNKPAETQSCSSGGGGGGGSSKKECADGDDNDEDGLTDYPDDPGCNSYSDDDEFNEEVVEEVITSSDDEKEEEIEEDKEDLIEEVSVDQIIKDIESGAITITSNLVDISHSSDFEFLVRSENKIIFTIDNQVSYPFHVTSTIKEKISENQFKKEIKNLDKFEEKIGPDENYEQIKKLHFYLEKENVKLISYKESEFFPKSVYDFFNKEQINEDIKSILHSPTAGVVSNKMVEDNAVSNIKSISGIIHSSKLIVGSLFEPTITKRDQFLIDAGTEKVGELDLLAGISLEPKEVDLILYSGDGSSTDKIIYDEKIVLERSNIGTEIDLDHVNNLIDVYLVIPQIDSSSITKHDYDLELNILGDVKEKQTSKVPVRFSAYNSFSNLFSGNNLLFTESYGSYVIAENDGYIFAQQLIYDSNVYSKEEYVLSLNVYQDDSVIANNKFNLNLKTGVVTQIVDNEESINNNNFNGITGGVIAREGDPTSGTVDNFLSLMVVMILITLGLIYSNSIKRTVVKSVMNIGSKVRNNVPDSKTIKKLRKANHDLEDSFIRD